MISCKVISGGGRFTLSPEQNQSSPTKLSSTEPCSTLSFRANLTIPTTLSIKNPSPVSFRNVAAACGAAGGCCSADACHALPRQTTETLYELLGIPESGTLAEIKKAYKLLARKYHPDVSSPENIEEHTRRFLMVKEAYETLSDPQSRALYDTDLANGLAFSAMRRTQHNLQGVNDKGEWKSRWQSQLNELKRRSMNKHCRGKPSWVTRMRRQRDDNDDEDE